jgi:hypothetical protein
VADFGQTVYDVGDPITSQLSLGVTPDVTTTVALAVTRPDGTAITPPVIGPWVGDTKTAQWYATDDGTSTGTKLASAGDWLAVWQVGGTGANVLAKVYNVAPLPGTSVRVAWSPFLSQVADHVPYLTVDTATPGSQLFLGTFTGRTTPTDAIAQRHIDLAVATMSPSVANISAALFPAARAVASLRAAASLARAYPRRAEDLNTAAALDASATASWAILVDAAEAEGTVTGTVLSPVGFFPPASAWGDIDL